MNEIKKNMDEIENLRAALRKAETDVNKRSTLVARREEIQMQLENLKSEIDTIAFSVHQMQEHQRGESENLSKELELRKHILKQIRQNLIEADHALDSIEEASEEQIENLKARLASAIMRNQPELETEYKSLQQAIEEARAIQKMLEHSSGQCRSLIQLLESAIQMRQTVKRRGILSYIFGSNPNFVITRYLQSCALLAQSVKDSFALNEHNLLSDNVLQKLYADANNFLDTLCKHCQERWGFRKIDTTFSEAVLKLKEFLHGFDRREEVNRKKLEDNERTYRDWLEGKYEI